MTVCVMTDNNGDPLSEDLVDSSREDISIVACKSDWAFVKALERGDKLTRVCVGKNYVVQEVVEDFAMGFVIKARQAKCK